TSCRRSDAGSSPCLIRPAATPTAAQPRRGRPSSTCGLCTGSGWSARGSSGCGWRRTRNRCRRGSWRRCRCFWRSTPAKRPPIRTMRRVTTTTITTTTHRRP
ncbi:unnamed protein product, partial [Ectocarpus sp. 12 AP-2014]